MIIRENNIEMTRGDTEELTVYVPSKAFVAGDIIELTIRKTPAAKLIFLHKTVSDFTEKEGKAVFHFEPEDTASIPWGKYSYDIQATFADIGVKTIIKPSAFVLGEEDTYGIEEPENDG